MEGVEVGVAEGGGVAVGGGMAAARVSPEKKTTRTSGQLASKLQRKQRLMSILMSRPCLWARLVLTSITRARRKTGHDMLLPYQSSKIQGWKYHKVCFISNFIHINVFNTIHIYMFI